MTGRGKLRISADLIREEELLEGSHPDRQFPLDSLQSWLHQLINKQKESNNRWKQMTEIARNEQKRGSIQLRLLTATREAARIHRTSKGILTREQQEELDTLEKRAQEIRNSVQGPSHPLLAIEPAPIVTPAEEPRFILRLQPH